MTTFHKVVLSLIATVCISLIVFYSIQGNNQRSQPVAVVVPGPGAAPSPAELDAKAKADAAARASALEQPVIVGPSAATRPAGLDELVAKVRSEIVTNEPVQAVEENTTPQADASARANAPTAIELSEASRPSADAGAPVAPPVTLTPITPTSSSTDDDQAFADLAIEEPPVALAVDAPKANGDAAVPTFTLGEPPRKSLTADAPDQTAAAEADAEALATRDLLEGRIAEISGRRDPLPPLVQIRSNEESTAKVEATPKAETVIVVDPHKPAVKAEEPKAAIAAADIKPAATKTTTETEPQANANGPSVAPKPEPVKPAATPATTSALKTYTVKPGDSFSTIALRELGAERHWLAIVDANPGVDPKRIKVGQVINLPEVEGDEAKPVAPAGAAAASSTSKPDAAKLAITSDAKPAAAASEDKLHEVRAGENLSSISRRYFNTPDHWRHIYITNRDIIGGDPGKLHAGLKLKITTPKAD